MAIRRKRIDFAFRDSAISQLGAMPITTDQETDTFAWTRTLEIADRCALTLYDAAYFELAQRQKSPLATLDRALRAGAKTVGVVAIGV